MRNLRREDYRTFLYRLAVSDAAYNAIFFIAYFFIEFRIIENTDSPWARATTYENWALVESNTTQLPKICPLVSPYIGSPAQNKRCP